MGRSPAFQCYAKDLYTGTSDLSSAEFGAYWRGICWTWDNGPLPFNTVKRRRALLLELKEYDHIWPQIRGLWKRTPKGFVNARLEQIRKEQDAYREKQAEKARKRHSHGTATAQPRQYSGSLPAHAGAMPCDLRSAPLDQNQDQDHRADARKAHKVAVRLAHDALSQNPDDAREILKVLLAEAHIPYDAGAVSAALSAAEAQRSKFPRAVES